MISLTGIVTLPDIDVLRVYDNKSSDNIIVFGNFQDKTKKVLAYKKNLSTGDVEAIYTFHNDGVVSSDRVLYGVINYKEYNYKNIEHRLKVEFIDGTVPFYIENGEMFDRKHKRITSVSTDFIELFSDYNVYHVSTETYLFLIWQKAIILYCNSKMAIFQSSTFEDPVSLFTLHNPIYHPDAIVLDSSVFNMGDIQLHEIINDLAKMKRFKKMVKYVERKLIFNSI
jgi:hypothetical protein